MSAMEDREASKASMWSAARHYLDDMDLDMQHRSSTLPKDGLVAGTTEGKRPAAVYTAFDGDHFAAVPLMRRHALSRGMLPLNPESVVGYKDSVDAFHTKFGVLKADIAVVTRCSAFWIYVDRKFSANLISELAEGVLLELLWYLRVCRDRQVVPDVRLVNLQKLIRGGDPEPEPLPLAFSQLVSSLAPEQRELLYRVEDLDRWGLPSLIFCVHDPLDSKYAHWLRAYGHKRGIVALVPTLALELSDGSLNRVVNGWLSLLTLADRLWTLESIESRPASGWAQICRHLAQLRGLTEESLSWTDVGAPKAFYGQAWALSARERRGRGARAHLQAGRGTHA